MKLSPESLRKTYDAGSFSALREAMDRHQKGIIGQKRAVRALQFGLGNRAPGFNVYVSASDGDAKFPVIEHFLRSMVQQDPMPSDWCYVNNFADPYCPNALCLPRGMAKKFKSDIENFIAQAKGALIKTFESEEFIKKQSAIKEGFNKQQQLLVTELNEKAIAENLVIKQTPMEILAIPVVNNQPLTPEQFQTLSKAERDVIRDKQREFQQLMQTVMRKSRDIDREAGKAMLELEQNAALYAIGDLLDDVLEVYRDIEEIPEYLEALKNDILENLFLFLQDGKGQNDYNLISQQKSLEQRYEVNVLVDNEKVDTAPIVVELNPNYNNLFGKIERESVMGTLVTNFSLIRSGSLHHANGGYLVLPVDELLRSPFSWDTLKRALRNQRIEIEDPYEKLGLISAKSLKPEPVPLNVQVILVGNPRWFHLLYNWDEDFKKLFKVKADFDPVMEANAANVQDMCSLVATICQEESLLSVGDAALAKILEHGHRLADHQEKLITETDDIADLLREANYYARAAGAKEIDAAHILEAIREKHYRSDLIQEKIKEMIAREVIFIDTAGEKIGQVNGLSVIDMGDIAFGRPSRITASVSMGQGVIIDVEKEAKMSGPIHTKGVLILSGFLFDNFGRDKPLNLAVSLVFEQSYSGVDGDSASSTELYAILSRLADVPIKQGIAVTGSVNQRGEVQPVGGINQKIEGYFDVCQVRGLNGEQGVMIPRSNVSNLMLKPEIVEAVANGRFHIWAVGHISEGIAILTGMEAGRGNWNRESGTMEFEPGTVFFRVNEELRRMSDYMRKLSKPE